MELFIEGPAGPPKYAAFFEASDGGSDAPTGSYLYVSSLNDDRILWHACVSESIEPGLEESSIQISWSRDWKKCGVVVGGHMRAVINLSTGVEFQSCSEDKTMEGVTWEQEFDQYLDIPAFLRARQLYWKRKTDPNGTVLPDAQPVTSKLVEYRRCNDLAAVFEDDGETAYLYLYDPGLHTIRDFVQVYDEAASLSIGPGDVGTVWATSCSKCAVRIFGAFRAIIDVQGNRTGRAKLTKRSSPGLTDDVWLSGFSADDPNGAGAPT
jgi:hypothetical protein